jgi:hypothetical protein
MICDEPSSDFAKVLTDHCSEAETGNSDELEIEIPGGFENIETFENDMSASTIYDPAEYIIVPKLDKWIGEDWDDVSITSDLS